MPDPITGFPPIASKDARVLILGSMPSEESLKQQQYYAHPRNGFWPIVMSILGQDPGLAYPQRVKQLIEHKIAVWDVLHSCIRKGSLDSAINNRSIQANDFNSFFETHSQLQAILFNGRKAEEIYSKYVLPNLEGRFRSITQYVLPSTSPAMASLDREQKKLKWNIVQELLAVTGGGDTSSCG